VRTLQDHVFSFCKELISRVGVAMSQAAHCHQPNRLRTAAVGAASCSP
jgi:hypothetical protein